MKHLRRTNKGYETENYKIERYITKDIFTCRKEVGGFFLINKKTGEWDFHTYLSDARKDLVKMGELEE